MGLLQPVMVLRTFSDFSFSPATALCYDSAYSIDISVHLTQHLATLQARAHFTLAASASTSSSDLDVYWLRAFHDSDKMPNQYSKQLRPGQVPQFSTLQFGSIDRDSGGFRCIEFLQLPLQVYWNQKLHSMPQRVCIRPTQFYTGTSPSAGAVSR